MIASLSCSLKCQATQIIRTMYHIVHCSCRWLHSMPHFIKWFRIIFTIFLFDILFLMLVTCKQINLWHRTSLLQPNIQMDLFVFPSNTLVFPRIETEMEWVLKLQLVFKSLIQLNIFPSLQTPLEQFSVDVAIFCLSLMGTNYPSYLEEANRVLKPRSA